MLILTEKIAKEKLNELETLGEQENFFEDMIKAVVDIRKELLAINAELHSDLEKYLLDNGSDNKDLYGINILLDDYEIEFDSLINPPRNREAGFPRAGRDVADPIAREKIVEVVNRWIER
ncbi:MAG: DUF5674 family protein [Bacteroidales bacterium]|nr:DUF5674 family protein [Bacteroidales bacterium]MCM1415113.1 DUF5674 family protein [bacterium]MCM1423807.1 DUF5674 family protein [bacterium]